MTHREPLRESDLAAFTGTENWYRHALTRCLYTDGAKYVADKCGAYWLIDEIALAQRFVRPVAREEFQVWNLSVGSDGTAALVCDDGNDNIVWSKELKYTDFPPPGVRLYFSNNTLYLPSEY